MDGEERQQIALEALEHYQSCSPEVQFVRHNENLAFCVTAQDGSKYLLRIHEPASANFSGPGQRPGYIVSELRWIEALQDKFIVQQPVRNRDGDLVTTFVFGGIERQCSLLTWIEGQDFDQQSTEAPERMHDVGAMVARLHDHSRRWQPPADFVRPIYDETHIREIRRKLLPAVDLEWLTADDFAVLERALEEAQTIFDIERARTFSQRTPTLPSPKGEELHLEAFLFNEDGAEEDGPGLELKAWGLIHADLGPWNLVVHERGISPIDFGLCAYAPYLWDLGSGMVSYRRELRRPFLEGYGPLPEGSMRVMEASAVLGILSCFAMHISNPDRHEWLASRVPKSVGQEWRRFLAGEAFLFEI